MVASDRFWWFTPLQIATTVVAGMNCGASALQSPLTWPMLQEGLDVPVHYVGRQTENLLRGSEFLFPPFNAFCTIGNLVMTGLTYYNPQSPRSEKLPLFAIATGMHVVVTIYTLTVMAPYNTKLKIASKKLNQGVAKGEEKSASQRKATEDFRDAQKIWKVGNYGRGLIMLAAVATSAIALSS
ncbi:hypothetical protein E2P81_ATG05610 [Venturia nashicola]|uniref:DUF1772-domain-containing protein n=1 Tax=Venturia nashicola TaxID=86259 RepID=A0A4Z1PG93_9PEZI|nr:hypothetical protein E6O75_ATG05747 [Venturia nashicola]TLD32634.1 hypothetical protein E2P81_ATG05610 [Venturia nashicola]